jgi:hypothetical protein
LVTCTKSNRQHLATSWIAGLSRMLLKQSEDEPTSRDVDRLYNLHLNKASGRKKSAAVCALLASLESFLRK